MKGMDLARFAREAKDRAVEVAALQECMKRLYHLDREAWEMIKEKLATGDSDYRRRKGDE